MQPKIVAETNSRYVVSNIKYKLREHGIRCYTRRIELEDMQNDRYSHYRYRILYTDMVKQLRLHRLTGVYVYNKRYDEALNIAMREANILNVYHGYRTYLDSSRVIIIDARRFMRDMIRMYITERVADITPELTANSKYYFKFECKNRAVKLSLPHACRVYNEVGNEVLRAVICRLIGCLYFRIVETSSSNCITRRVKVF